MKIGELAKQTGCNVETIRYYERMGLLSSPQRTASGYRHYNTEQHSQLNFILHCRSLGMSLADIHQIATFKHNLAAGCEGINQLIDHHIQNVHRQIKNLKRLEQQLLALRRRCNDRHTVAECGILQTLSDAAEGEPCACHAPFKRSPPHIA